MGSFRKIEIFAGGDARTSDKCTNSISNRSSPVCRKLGEAIDGGQGAFCFYRAVTRFVEAGKTGIIKNTGMNATAVQISPAVCGAVLDGLGLFVATRHSENEVSFLMLSKIALAKPEVELIEL